MSFLSRFIAWTNICRYYNATVALSAGVRLLQAQFHDENGTIHLCHTSCALFDAGPLDTWLSSIKSWMDANTNDVVTLLLVNSDNIDTGRIGQAFESSGISTYGFVPSSPGEPMKTWPTLNSLISSNNRLVTFISSLSSYSTTYPYLLDEFTHIFENNFSVTTASNFTCTPARPSAVAGSVNSALSSNLMPFMNHFLDLQQIFGIETPDVNDIASTNSPTTSGVVGSLGSSAVNCTEQYGEPLKFVLVDFFDQGNAIAAVDQLNGIQPVGRTAVPPRATTSGGSQNTKFAWQSLYTLMVIGVCVVVLG